jgi:murein DD-endopeptidase MepM/ murein hydrolase activator NlpD
MIPLMQEFDRITSPYGNRRHPRGYMEFHKGVDFRSDKLLFPVKAFVAGTVVHAKFGAKGSGVGDYGYTVIIKDRYDHLHLYAHLAEGSICVKVGDKVKAGQQIGKQGNTGASFGDHLHYEVRPFGNLSRYGYIDGKPDKMTVEPISYVDNYYKKHPEEAYWIAKPTPQPAPKKPIDYNNKEEVEMVLQEWQKKMGIDAATYLKQQGLLNDPAQFDTEEELAQPMPAWMVLTLIARVKGGKV